MTVIEFYSAFSSGLVAGIAIGFAIGTALTIGALWLFATFLDDAPLEVAE